MTSPAITRRIMRELSELQSSPPEGIRIQSSDQDMLDITGIIQGPDGTPYAGGYFKVKFKFTEEFPAAPPKCWFATKIFHPNVGPTGEICVNTLKKDWKSTYGISHILVTVKCLLIYPNPESALDEEAGRLLLENYDSYCMRAKLITSVHATPKKPPVEFDTPAATESNTESSETNVSIPSVPPAQTTSEPSSSKLPSVPIKSSSLTTPSPPTSSASSARSNLNVPIITRKSASPVPPPPVKSSCSADLSKDKERHPSPSPLATADANVGKPVTVNLGIGVPTSGAANNTKAVKRSATNGVPSGAEKRKKALKRL